MTFFHANGEMRTDAHFVCVRKTNKIQQKYPKICMVQYEKMQTKRTKNDEILIELKYWWRI